MILEAAVVTCTLFVGIVLSSLAYNPRLWMLDFPAAMQAELAPLSRRDGFARALLAVAVLGVVIGVPFLAVLSVEATRGDVSFVQAFWHVWLVLMAVNVVDLVLVDWLIGIRWQPDFLSTPEFEPLEEHNTFRYHLVEHLKGAGLLTGLALTIAGVVVVI